MARNTRVKKTIVQLGVIALAMCLAVAASEATEESPHSFNLFNPAYAKPATIDTLITSPRPWADKGRRNNSVIGASVASSAQDLERTRQGLARLLAPIEQRIKATVTKTNIKAIELAGNQTLARDAKVQAAGGTEARFDGRNGTVTFLKIKQSPQSINGKATSQGVTKRLPKTTTMEFLNNNRELLKLSNPSLETKLIKQETDSVGLTHLKYQQMFAGVPIFGKQLNVHLGNGGDVYLLNGRYEPTPENIDISPTISKESALVAVINDLGQPSVVATNASSDLMIYIDHGNPVLVYKISVSPNLTTGWTYFVDAKQGHIVHRINDIQTAVVAGSGKDLNGVNRTFNVWSESGTFYLISSG